MSRLYCANGGLGAHPHVCLSSKSRAPAATRPCTTSRPLCPHRSTLQKSAQQHQGALQAMPSSSPSPSALQLELFNLTVVQLKDKLRQLGLPVSGRKMELVERLVAASGKDAGNEVECSNEIGSSNENDVSSDSSSTRAGDTNGNIDTISGSDSDTESGSNAGSRKHSSVRKKSKGRPRKNAAVSQADDGTAAEGAVASQGEGSSLSQPVVESTTGVDVSVPQDAPTAGSNVPAQGRQQAGSSQQSHLLQQQQPVDDVGNGGSTTAGQSAGTGMASDTDTGAVTGTVTEAVTAAVTAAGAGVGARSVSSSVSEEEKLGAAVATRIATVATIEALLEKMEMDDDEGEDSGEPVVNPGVAAQWLRERAASAAREEAAEAAQQSRQSEQSEQHVQSGRGRETRRPGKSEAAKMDWSPPSREGTPAASSTDQSTGVGRRSSGRKGTEGSFNGMTFSEVSAAIRNCTSVETVAALVASITAERPLARPHLCATIQRLARVTSKDAPEVSPTLHQLVGDLCVQLLDQLHLCDVRALSTLLWSLGRLGFQPVGEFSVDGRIRQLEEGYVSASVVACLTMMDDYGWRKARPVDLVDILEGLVRLELNEPELATEVVNRLKSQLPRADSYCVSHALWAVSKLADPPMGFVFAATRRLARLCTQDIRPFEMSTALAGCVHLGYKDDGLLAAMKNKARWALPSMQPADISVLCWGLASLEDNDTNFLRFIIQHITRERPPSALPPRLLVNVTWASARMAHYSKPLLDLTMRCLQPRLASLPSSQLVQLTWSMAKLGHYNKQLFEVAAERIRNCLQELDVQAVSSVLWSYAHLGVQSPALFSSITAKLLDQPIWSAWLTQDLAMTAWSLALLETGEGELFKQLMDAASKLLHHNFTAAELAQIFQMYLKLKDQPERYEEAVQHMEQQCQALLEAGREVWLENMADNQHKVSRACYEITGQITSLGYVAQVEQSTQDGLFSIDIVVQLDADTQLAVEVDGPSHYTKSNPRRQLGSSIWRNKLLEARGWRVVNVALHELARFNTAEERRLWLQQQLQSAHRELISGREGGGGEADASKNLQQQLTAA